MPRVPGFARILGYGIVMVAIALLLLEGYLRVFDPMGISYFKEVRKYDAAHSRGFTYNYIHKPGFKETLQGVDVHINSRGLRSPEFSTVKKDGVKRVLILGDSVVFGWGVAQDDIVSAQCQRLMGSGWEFVGAGVGSWNTRTEYEFLAAHGDSIAPDAVVLIITGNDAIPHAHGHTDVPIDTLIFELARDAYDPSDFYSELTEQTYVVASYRFMTGARAAGGARAERLCDTRSASWRDTDIAVSRIVYWCEGRGVTLIPYVFIDPSPCRGAFENALAKRGARARSFPTELDSKAHRNSIVDSHPNARGHALMATTICNDLASIVGAH